MFAHYMFTAGEEKIGRRHGDSVPCRALRGILFRLMTYTAYNGSARGLLGPALFCCAHKERGIVEYCMRLPRNKRELCLFMAIISVISVNIIAPRITCFEMGFSFSTWAAALRTMPFIWLAVVACVLATYLPAEWATGRILDNDDSYNAHILTNNLVTVCMMSVILTIVAPWIATGGISMEPIEHFFFRWPRNFAISLFVEALIAQSLARAAMNKLHVWHLILVATPLPNRSHDDSGLVMASSIGCAFVWERACLPTWRQEKGRGGGCPLRAPWKLGVLWGDCAKG